MVRGLDISVGLKGMLKSENLQEGKMVVAKEVGKGNKIIEGPCLSAITHSCWDRWKTTLERSFKNWDSMELEQVSLCKWIAKNSDRTRKPEQTFWDRGACDRVSTDKSLSERWDPKIPCRPVKGRGIIWKPQWGTSGWGRKQNQTSCLKRDAGKLASSWGNTRKNTITILKENVSSYKMGSSLYIYIYFFFSHSI